MMYDDGVELLEQYYEQKILNNSMLNDVLKSMNSQCDYNHLDSYGLHLISLLKQDDKL